MNDWIKEHLELLKAGKLEEMLILKMEHFPSAFFKYRSLATGSLLSLNEDWLWMSEPKYFNDPFECSLLLNNNELLKDLFGRVEVAFKLNLSPNDINRIVESPDSFKEYRNILSKRGLHIPLEAMQQFEKLEISWQKGMQKINEPIRICSFSTINDSLLMWAHYADNYKGICIEYDFIDENHLRGFLMPVFYSDERTFVKKFDEINIYTNLVASLSKSIDWAYEKEWRLTYFTDSQIRDKQNRFAVPIPQAIYLGPRFELNNKKDKEAFYRIVMRKNIPVYQMKIHASEYKLVKI